MKFPDLSEPEPPMRGMSIQEYIDFCTHAIESNPMITADTCMQIRQDEADMQEPFRLTSKLMKVAEAEATWPQTETRGNQAQPRDGESSR